MFIQIDRQNDSKYIYQQIYEILKNQILNGERAVHQKLPSKRQLATELQVSLNSVTLAYEQLLAEGYIYTIERSGYFVEEIMNVEADLDVQNDFPLDLKEIPESCEDWISLSHMSTNSGTFPFKSWLKHQKEAIEQHANELNDFSHPQGPYLLRESIANLIKSTRGVTCAPEQIIIHSTSQGLLDQLLSLQPKETVFALENPGYARYFHLLSRHKRSIEIIPLDKNGVDINHLSQSNSQFLITTPSHQFPTGRIMPVSRRMELLNWASAQEDRYIIEDDYDSDFKYKTDNIPSLQSLDFNQRVIYMGTFSKTLLPGMRISYMVLPIKLLRQYRTHFNSLIQPANILALYTLNHFIRTGAYQKHVRKMNNHYEQLRAAVIQKLKLTFKDRIEITNIPAGLHFIVRVDTKKSYEDIEASLVEQRLEMYTIRRFLNYPDDYYLKNRYIIVGFANLTLEEIDEAIKRLKRALFKM